jgi:AhpD family alkylhydroperoxidase
MQVIGNPGPKMEGAGFTPATEGDKLDFELACLAASAITGCESCVRSHEKAVRERGGTKEMVQDAVRIAAVVNAVAIALPLP